MTASSSDGALEESHYVVVEDFQLIFHSNLHVNKFLPKLRDFNCTSTGTGVGRDNSLEGLVWSDCVDTSHLHQ